MSAHPEKRLVLTGKSLLVSVFIAAAMLVLMGVQPILGGLYVEHLHLALSQNGWVLASEQLGAATGALMGFWLSTRARWSHVIVGACAIAAASNIATALSVDFTGLLLARFSSGAASTISYTVAIYLLGHARAPDRIFGVLLILQTLFMAMAAAALPTLAQHFGFAWAVGSGATWFVASILVAPWLPKQADLSESHAPQQGGRDCNRLLGITGLAGSFLLQVSIFAVWGFLERVGRLSSLSDPLIGYAIGIGVLGGILGGLLPAVVGARFGRLTMITAATALLTFSYGALSQRESWGVYTASITVLNMGWVLSLIYYMGLTVQHDRDGRLTRLIPFAQTFGTGVGPLCSALVTSNDQLWPIFIVGSIAAAAGWLCVAAAALTRRPSSLALMP